MTINIGVQNTLEMNDDDYDRLVRRQEELEREIARLKEIFHDMKESSSHTFGRVFEKIDVLEKEVAEVRETLNELRASVKLIQVGVTSVQQHVSDINAKQDVSITAQDKFIIQLWRAFFALLGVITLAGGAIVTLIK